jgi:hypothetical protein
MNAFIKERRNNFQSISKCVLALSSCLFCSMRWLADE